MKMQFIYREESLEIASTENSVGVSTRSASASAIVSLAFALGLFFSSTADLKAREREDLDISLKAQQVLLTLDGERLVDNNAVKPGDVVHYTANFHNTSARSLHNLAPTIPVPAGMEFQPAAGLAAPSEASLDGRNFETFPVRREHILADGRKVLLEVPVAAYRILRWNAGELAPGATYTAAARMRVKSHLVAHN